MKKNKKLLSALLSIVLLAVVGLSAYAYQKYQTSDKLFFTKNKSDSKIGKILSEKVKSFNSEKDLKTKISILKELVSYKQDVNNESNEKVKKEYNSAVTKMKEDVINNINDVIKSLTLSDEDKKDKRSRRITVTN